MEIRRRTFGSMLSAALLAAAPASAWAATITYTYAPGSHRLASITPAEGPVLTHEYDAAGSLRYRYGVGFDGDGDGLVDIDEVRFHFTDPALADTDNDGLDDGEEVLTYATDPLDEDSDGDGESDGDEVAAGRDPLLNEAAAIVPILRMLLESGER